MDTEKLISVWAQLWPKGIPPGDYHSAALAAELVESLRAQEEIQALSALVVSSSLPSQYINVSEAAALAGTTREMVYRAVRKGHLPAKDGPGGKVVDRADVLGWSRVRRRRQKKLSAHNNRKAA